ncbi:RNA polymerase sigma factor [Henriciella aquimarina]|uniref:RNA polymerase sigma factor n=1 Tax=Henriciella aquimarina TaxID=545261 RepID=UPI0013019F0C|nr:RNA polymerase sigma factor [Henriciella aquimarina]
MSETPLIQAYRDNEADIVEFLARRMKSAPNARDVVQDLCVKIWSERPPVPERNARGYLFRMAANLATDYQRREIRNARACTAVETVSYGNRATPSPEELLITADQLERMKAAVARMPDLSRRIFYLARFEGLTQREIAREVGLSPAGVFKRMRRVMEELARIRDED